MILERFLPPHPGPLPRGEGATQGELGCCKCAALFPRIDRQIVGLPFSLSLGERAGVRGKEAALCQKLRCAPGESRSLRWFRLNAAAILNLWRVGPQPGGILFSPHISFSDAIGSGCC